MTRVRVKMTNEDTINIPGDSFKQDGEYTYIWLGNVPVAMLKTEWVMSLFITAEKEKA